MKNSGILKYVISTYLLFWSMILLLGGTLNALNLATPFVMQWVVVICSWTPTFTFLLLFKKIKPAKSIKEFFATAFQDKVNLKTFAFTTGIMILIYALSVLVYSLFDKVIFNFNFSFAFPSVIWSVFFTILTGASGEESGWRGYLLPELNKKYGFVKGNILLGLIWAFWHLPLWFLTSGFEGFKLLLYIFFFIISVTSFSIFMGYVQEKCRNLFLAFWMHFLFNLSFVFIIVNGLIFVFILGMVYLLLAIFILSKYKSKNNKH